MAKRTNVGSPSQEMFLDKPSGRDSPTIEPLRIQKRDGASPEPRAGRPGQRPGAGAPQTYSPPPGASASLPYPDFEGFKQQQQQRTQNSRLPYPNDEAGTRPGMSSSAEQSPSPPLSARPAIPEYPRPPGQSSRPAERRTTPKPLPDSPGPETPDKEGLFQRMPKRNDTPPAGLTAGPRKQAQTGGGNYDYQRHYFPPPGESSNNLSAPDQASVNRFSSTASNSTTRASRGSPPPPETPVVPPDSQPGGGIEARYAAAGIAGTGTLTGLQAQSAAAAQRAQQYGNQPPRNQSALKPQQEQPPRRPWTPTELPGAAPSVPPTVYQGAGQTSSPPSASPPAQASGMARPATGSTSKPIRGSGQAALEQDMQRLQVTNDPPPAYSSVTGKPGAATSAQGYPNEKASGGAAASAAGAAAGAAGGAAASSSSQAAGPSQVHPAFANEQHQNQGPSPQPAASGALGISTSHAEASPAPQGAGPAAPPPLPEGWIAHIDPSSGQYYYIHLPTQSTQWEFPKGPTPLNLNEPTSPIGGSFGGFGALQSPVGSTFSKPLASPAIPGYAESVMSMQSTTPTVSGFTGPPPSSGVDFYKIQPTNGVYFGPYLRYSNMDLERGIWLGSILLVTDAPQPPTIHIHQSTDLSPNPRQLKGSPISKHQRWTFYRYELDLIMEEHGSAKWTYAITSHLGCTRYEFLVAGKHDTNWRFVATSGNDFALNVKAEERNRLGGVGFMWKDIMTKHAECGGFHAQLGLGDQIYADRIWKEIPVLKQWLSVSGKENRRNEAWTAAHEEDVSHAYFHFYTSHFDQPYLREAFAQIPYILTIDDHDLRWIWILSRIHAVLQRVQEHWPYRHRHVPPVPAPHDARAAAQRQQRHGHLHRHRHRLALCQVPRPRRGGGGAGLPLGAQSAAGAGGTDVAGHLPQGGHAAGERAALRVDGAGATRVPAPRDGRADRPGRGHGQEGRHRRLQRARQGHQLRGRRGRRQAGRRQRFRLDQARRRQDGPDGQHPEPVRRRVDDGRVPRLVDARLQGPRTHLPYPHAPRHRAPALHPHDLPQRRRRLLRGGPGARPVEAAGPQDHVPAHLVVGGQRAAAGLHHQAAAQQPPPVRACQRAALDAPAVRHQGGHDGDLPGRARRPPARAQEAHGPPQLRRHRRLRPGGRAGHLRPHQPHAARRRRRRRRRRRQVEPGGRLHGAARGLVRRREQVRAGDRAELGVWAVEGPILCDGAHHLESIHWWVELDILASPPHDT